MSTEKQDAIVMLYHFLLLDEKDLSNKKKVMKVLLQYYRDYNDTAYDAEVVKKLIGGLRVMGHDYPELKTIEKSLEKKMKVSELLEALMGQKAKRAEFLINTYKQKWKGVEGYKDIEKFVDHIGTLDPSHNGAYMQWMMKLVLANPRENKVEDLERVAGDLGTFEENKSRIQNKDVNSYKSFQQLFGVIEVFTKPREKSKEELEMEKEEAKREKIRKDIDTVYEGPEGWVKIPLTKQASIYLGKLTRWCTAAEKSSNYFDSYNNRDKLFVIYDREKKMRSQIHVQSGEYRDEKDASLGVSKLPGWAGKQIVKWYKAHPENMKLKHIMSLGSHDPSIAAGTHHEDVLKLMQKYGV